MASYNLEIKINEKLLSGETVSENHSLEHHKRLPLREFSESSLFSKAWSIISFVQNPNKNEDDMFANPNPESKPKKGILKGSKAPQRYLKTFGAPQILGSEVQGQVPQILRSDVEGQDPEIAESLELIQRFPPTRRFSTGINGILENDIPGTVSRINHEERLENEYKELIRAYETRASLLEIKPNKHCYVTKAFKSMSSCNISSGIRKAFASLSYDSWGTLCSQQLSICNRSKKIDATRRSQSSVTQRNLQAVGEPPLSLLDEKCEIKAEETNTVLKNVKYDDDSTSQFPSVIPSSQNCEVNQSPEQIETPKRKWSDLITDKLPVVISYTGESVRSLLDVADHVISNYFIAPDDNPLTEEEMNEKEDRVVIKIMRLLGVPLQLRHNIYQEALHNIQALEDLSVGTLSLLNNIIDWLTFGDCGGREAILNKLRIIACTMETDDSCVWGQMDQDLSVFSNAVENAIKQSVESTLELFREYSQSEPIIVGERSDLVKDDHDVDISRNKPVAPESSTYICDTSVRTESISASTLQTINENEPSLQGISQTTFDVEDLEEFGSNDETLPDIDVQTISEYDANCTESIISESNSGELSYKRGGQNCSSESELYTPRDLINLQNPNSHTSRSRCREIDAFMQAPNPVNNLSSVISIACESIKSSVISQVQKSFPILTLKPNTAETLTKTQQENENIYADQGYDGDDEERPQPQRAFAIPVNPGTFNSDSNKPNFIPEPQNGLNSFLTANKPVVLAHRPYKIENHTPDLDSIPILPAAPASVKPQLSKNVQLQPKISHATFVQSNPRTPERTQNKIYDYAGVEAGTTKSVEPTNSKSLDSINEEIEDSSSELCIGNGTRNNPQSATRDKNSMKSNSDETEVQNDLHQIEQIVNNLYNEVKTIQHSSSDNPIPNPRAKASKIPIKSRAPSVSSLGPSLSFVSTIASNGSSLGLQLHRKTSTSTSLNVSYNRPKQLKVISTVPWKNTITGEMTNPIKPYIPPAAASHSRSQNPNNNHTRGRGLARSSSFQYQSSNSRATSKGSEKSSSGLYLAHKPGYLPPTNKFRSLKSNDINNNNDRSKSNQIKGYRQVHGARPVQVAFTSIQSIQENQDNHKGPAGQQNPDRHQELPKKGSSLMQLK